MTSVTIAVMAKAVPLNDPVMFAKMADSPKATITASKSNKTNQDCSLDNLFLRLDITTSSIVEYGTSFLSQEYHQTLFFTAFIGNKRSLLSVYRYSRTISIFCPLDMLFVSNSIFIFEG